MKKHVSNKKYSLITSLKIHERFSYLVAVNYSPYMSGI